MCWASSSAVLPPDPCGTTPRCRSSTSMAAGCTGIYWEKARSRRRPDHAVCNTSARLRCPVQRARASGNAEVDVAKLKQTIETSFESDYPKLDALYKDIHAHPEIAAWLRSSPPGASPR